MRFLADEHFPLASVVALRNAGHDVAFILEDSPGLDDERILERAADERRVVLTFDRDDGDLIYGRGVQACPAVAYFRIAAPATEEPAALLLKPLHAGAIDLEGITVVRRDQVRQRLLP